MKAKFTLTEDQKFQLSESRVGFIADDLFKVPPDSFKNTFFYSRDWGFFYVSTGMHQYLMYKLLSFENEVDDLGDLYYSGAGPEILKLSMMDHYDAADEYMKRPGTAYLSGAGYSGYVVRVGKISNLNSKERQLFADLGFELMEL